MDSGCESACLWSICSAPRSARGPAGAQAHMHHTRAPLCPPHRADRSSVPGLAAAQTPEPGNRGPPWPGLDLDSGLELTRHSLVSIPVRAREWGRWSPPPSTAGEQVLWKDAHRALSPGCPGGTRLCCRSPGLEHLPPPVSHLSRWEAWRHAPSAPGRGAPWNPPQGPWPTAATGPLSSRGRVLGKRHLQLPLQPLLFLGPCPSALTSRRPSPGAVLLSPWVTGPPHPPRVPLTVRVGWHPIPQMRVEARLLWITHGVSMGELAWVPAQVPCPAVSTLPAVRSPAPPWPLASVSGGPWRAL